MNRIFHGRDLRKGRSSLPNQVYLVTTVTKNRAPIFHDFKFARILIKSLSYQDYHGRSLTLAFVVMPDHLHWLLGLESQSNLSRIMQSVKRHSARQINLITGHSKNGLWQSGFHDHALRKEEDLQSVARYVVANPLRAGLVKQISDYPHWDAIWL